MLPKARRLRAKTEFDRVFETGRVVDRPELRIIWTRGQGRAAVVAAKTLGSLANRNRVRRRWREALRLSQECIPGDVDMVVLVKADGAVVRGRKVLEKLQETLRQLKI